MSLLSEPGCLSAIEQGITTQAVGLCGFSAGPLSAESRRGMIEEEPVFAFPDVAWDWTTIGGYRDAVAAAQPATNVTTFVGHNTLRRLVIGGADRPPTPPELERMRSLVREAIDQGARGFTTGLSYAPGLFASVDELSALAAVAAESGLMYHTHMRYGAMDVRGSVAEAIETAERAGVILNISHLYPRANQPLGRPTPSSGCSRRGGHAGSSHLRLDDFPARRRRVGAVAAGLGTRRRRRGDCRDHPRSGLRSRLIADLDRATDFWLNDWDDQVICKVNRPENAGLSGRTIGEIARERGHAPMDTALDLVLEDGQFCIAPRSRTRVTSTA